jgi:hypothetical protein
MARRVKLGTVAVDSGRLLLADPAHITADGLGAIEDQVLGRVPGLQVLGGMGLLFAAGLGDGTYDVYATLTIMPGRGERVTRVEVVLIADDDADAGDDILADKLAARAEAAESDPALMGSALAAYARSQGWDRGMLAARLALSPASLAALYCEARPVPTLTAGPGGGRGVFTPESDLMARVADLDANGPALVEAFKEGAALFALERG